MENPRGVIIAGFGLECDVFFLNNGFMSVSQKGQIVIYPPGRDITPLLIKRALSKVTPPWLNRVFHISPNATKKAFAEAEFAEIFKGEIAIPPRFTTLPQIAQVIAEKKTKREVVRQSIAGLILFEVARKDERIKEFFGGERKEISLGTTQKILGFFDEIRDYLDEDGINNLRAVLEEDLYEYERLKGRTQSALDLLPVYKDALKKSEILDLKEAMVEAIDSPMRIYPSPDVLILDGFLEWTLLEKRFIAKLIENSNYTIVSLPDPESLPEGEIIHRSVEFIRSLGNWQEVYEKMEGKVPPGEFYSFSLARNEVHFFVRTAKRILYEHPEKKILVSSPNMSFYSPLVEEELGLAGVPFSSWIERSANLDPGVSLFVDILHCVRENYPRKEVLRVLRSPFIDLEHDLKEILDGITRSLGIVGGDDWLSLDRKHFIFRENQNNREDLLPWVPKLERLIDRFFSHTEEFLKSKSPGEYAQSFRKFWAGIGGKPRLGGDSILTEVLSQLELVRDVSLDLPDFMRFLRSLAIENSPSIRADPREAVQLVEFRSTRGLEADYVFFLGVRDEDLPARKDPDPFLPEKTRQKVGLPTQAHHYSLQNLDFNRVIRSAREESYVSYAKMVNGRVSIPSIFTDFMKEMPMILNISEGIFTKEEEDRYLSARKVESYLDFLTQEDNLAALLDASKKRLHDIKRISVTQIEKYGKCPFRFFHEDILGLSTLREPTPELDKRKEGFLVHKVFEELYKDHTYKKDHLRENLEEALMGVFSVVSIDPFWQEALKRYLVGKIGLLGELEEIGDKAGLSPLFVEHRIERNLFQDIDIVGKIDRVDAGKNKARLIDYKTGKLPKIDTTDLIEGLQILLYGILFKEEYPQYEAVECLFVGLENRKGSKGVGTLGAILGIDPVLELRVRQLAQELLLRLMSGSFPAEPKKSDVCNGCIFSIIGSNHKGRCPYWLKK